MGRGGEAGDRNKKKGLVKYPINIPLKKDDPWLIEIFYSIVYGQGGHISTTTTTRSSTSRAARREVAPMAPRRDEEVEDLQSGGAAERGADIVKTMGAGNSAFTVLAKYNLAELNLGQHKERGHFRMALMPGTSHSTVGFVRFYAMSDRAADRGDEVVKMPARSCSTSVGRPTAVHGRQALGSGEGPRLCEPAALQRQAGRGLDQQVGQRPPRAESGEAGPRQGGPHALLGHLGHLRAPAARRRHPRPDLAAQGAAEHG